MVQSRVGELPLRFFQAVDIGHLVEVPKTERARDTSGHLVFRLPKLACDVGDFQVGQSDELSELPRPLPEESRNNIDRLMCLQLDSFATRQIMSQPSCCSSWRRFTIF